MWLRNGDRTVLVPEHMPDTIKRCLADGWVEVPDPRVVREPEPEADAQPAALPDPAFVQKLARRRINDAHANNNAARAAFNEMGMGPKGRR